jgi:hypothetical protein
MVLSHFIYYYFLISIKINLYVFNPSLFYNYVNKSNNILQITKLKNVAMRISPLYDVNFIVK